MIFKNITVVRCPWLFRKCLKRKDKFSKTLYLTFDDGPTPEITEQVLNILEEYNAKATFFCIGKNAENNPMILKKIKANGHAIGNHTYSHKNAFKLSSKAWLDNVMKESPVSSSKFFRPPYGKVTPWSFGKLSKKYTVVFWDVLTYDYREDIPVSKIKKILNNKVRNGSIIVFHDSVKAAKNMFPALEYTLKYFSEKGFGFERL